METVIITGGTGLIGTALTHQLIKNGYNVIILTRHASDKKNLPQLSYAAWDIEKQWMQPGVIEQADYIIHLAGANVADKRWSQKRKKEIVDSRVKSGDTIIKELSRVSNKVKAIISASAIGWYGPDPQIPNPAPFVETDPPANDFLGTTCQKWEATLQPVTALFKRLVILRTGIVLSREGGAFAEFKKPLQFRLATILGNGHQAVSWIHIDDLVQMYMAAIRNNSWNGIYNAVAPYPVNNATLIKEMAAMSGHKTITMHVPALALKTLLGEMSIEVLKSTTVSASRILEQGFNFAFPQIREAIRQLLGS